MPCSGNNSSQSFVWHRQELPHGITALPQATTSHLHGAGGLGMGSTHGDPCLGVPEGLCEEFCTSMSPSRLWGAAGACTDCEHPHLQWEMKMHSVERGKPRRGGAHVTPHGHRESTCLHITLCACVWLEEGKLVARKMLRNLYCLLTFHVCLVSWFICHIADINPKGTVQSAINHVALLYK